MTSKNIGKALKRKLDDWCASIGDEAVVKTIKENAIVTSGALLIAKKWFKQGVITQKDLYKLHRHFVKKYRPVIEMF